MVLQVVEKLTLVPPKCTRGCTESGHLLELKLYWCHVVMYRNHPEGCSCELFLCPGLVTPVLCLIYLKIPLAPAFCKLFLSQIRGHYPQPNFEGDYTYTYIYIYIYLYIYIYIYIFIHLFIKHTLEIGGFCGGTVNRSWGFLSSCVLNAHDSTCWVCGLAQLP